MIVMQVFTRTGHWKEKKIIIYRGQSHLLNKLVDLRFQIPVSIRSPKVPLKRRG